MKGFFGQKSSGKDEKQKRCEVELKILEIITGSLADTKSGNAYPLALVKFASIVFDKILANSNIDEETRRIVVATRKNILESGEPVSFSESEMNHDYGPIEMINFIEKDKSHICMGSTKFKASYLDRF